MAVIFGFEAQNLIFMLYGLIIVLIDGYGIFKPRHWIEWIERQFVYHRERIVAGAFFVLLGAGAIYFILPIGGWQGYLLSIMSAFFILIGLFLLILPDILRQGLIALAGLSDLWLRIFVLFDALWGVALVLIGIFL